jgi:hypothetical protein
MKRNFLERVVLGAICSMAVFAVTTGQTIAASKKAKELTSVVVATPTKQQSESHQNALIRRAPKGPSSVVTEPHPEAIRKRAKPIPAEVKPVNPLSSKSHRHMKVHRMKAPKAIVQPRTDLMHHGMLESPQRYDPRRSHLGTGVPDPHNPELTHDHFRELDRNQDGSIDPVERTFGRLDMERDLHNRRPR